MARSAHIRIALAAAIVAGVGVPIGLAQEQPAATQGAVAADGSLTAVITAFQGIVSVRAGPDQPWVKPTVGMTLPEGAEFRTGPKSALQFTIPPDQTITIDRASSVQLIRANFENGKVVTDLGMKYGRTRYDIETAGREHDAKVRSPSAVLAVRGTSFIAYDQPPFAPEAVSLDGRVMVRDIRKQVSVGSRNGGRNKVTPDADSPAATALAENYQSARANEGARSTNENQLGITVQNFLTQPDLQVGVFEIFKESQAQATLDSLSVIGVLPNPGLASFELSAFGALGTDVDLTVTSPLGEVVTIANGFDNPVPSGGTYFNNGVVVTPGESAFDQVLWTTTAPPGVYTVTQTLKSGGSSDTILIIFNDKNLNEPQQFGPINNTLTSSNPSTTIQVNLQTTPTPAQSLSVQAQRGGGGKKSKRK